MAISKINVEKIIPMHVVKTNKKLISLTESMKKYGWVGRPILVVPWDSEFEALTGSYRIAAAKAAGIPVEAAIINIDELDHMWADQEITLYDLQYMSDFQKFQAFLKANCALGVELMFSEVYFNGQST